MIQLERAFQSTHAVLSKVQPGHLDAPTPCVSWDVRALINHFVGSARWFAAVIGGAATGTGASSGAGSGSGADPAGEADYAAGDFAAAYERSIAMATAAFGADGVLARTVRLPFGEFPGAVVLGFAVTDQFTHGWDLARAIGHHTDLDPDLATELLGQVRLTIPGDYRGPEGMAPFGPAQTAPAGAGPADRLAAFLGRPV